MFGVDRPSHSSLDLGGVWSDIERVSRAESQTSSASASGQGLGSGWDSGACLFRLPAPRLGRAQTRVACGALQSRLVAGCLRFQNSAPSPCPPPPSFKLRRSFDDCRRAGVAVSSTQSPTTRKHARSRSASLSATASPSTSPHPPDCRRARRLPPSPSASAGRTPNSLPGATTTTGPTAMPLSRVMLPPKRKLGREVHMTGLTWKADELDPTQGKLAVPLYDFPRPTYRWEETGSS